MTSGCPEAPSLGALGPTRFVADLPPYGKDDELSALSEAGFGDDQLRQFGGIGY